MKNMQAAISHPNFTNLSHLGRGIYQAGYKRGGVECSTPQSTLGRVIAELASALRIPGSDDD